MANRRSAIITITIINLIIGLMIAAQFKTNQEPVLSESRDIRELRTDLQKEMERHQQLLSEMSKHELLLYQYETSVDEYNTLSIMNEELNQARALAGYSSVKGKGIVILIKEDYDFLKEQGMDLSEAQFQTSVVDEDLRTLVNELFYNGAKAISINDRRLTTTTSIRNVANQIQIDTYPIQMPFELKVIGDPTTLISAMKVTGMEDYFKVINKKLIITERNYLTVPAFKENIKIRYMKPVEDSSS